MGTEGEGERQSRRLESHRLGVQTEMADESEAFWEDAAVNTAPQSACESTVTRWP